MRRIPRVAPDQPYAQRYVPRPFDNAALAGIRLVRYALIINAIIFVTIAAINALVNSVHAGVVTLIVGVVVTVAILLIAPLLAVVRYRLALRDHQPVTEATYAYRVRGRNGKWTRNTFGGAELAQAEDWLDAQPGHRIVLRRISDPRRSAFRNRTALWHEYTEDNWGNEAYSDLLR